MRVNYGPDELGGGHSAFRLRFLGNAQELAGDVDEQLGVCDLLAGLDHWQNRKKARQRKTQRQAIAKLLELRRIASRQFGQTWRRVENYHVYGVSPPSRRGP